MMPYVYKCLTVLITLFLAAWGGHHLTYRFLQYTNIFPENHDLKKQLISKWIGITERLVVALLTMFGALVVTVFVFATKAAMMSTRLADEKGDKRQLTEFVLIGTLVSYFFGMLFGLAGKSTLELISDLSAVSHPMDVRIVAPVPILYPRTQAIALPSSSATNPPLPVTTPPSAGAPSAVNALPGKKNGHIRRN